jgi:hypothetical protein
MILSVFAVLHFRGQPFVDFAGIILYMGCPLLLFNIVMYVFFQKEDESSLAGAKYVLISEAKAESSKLKISNGVPL